MKGNKLWMLVAGAAVLGLSCCCLTTVIAFFVYQRAESSTSAPFGDGGFGPLPSTPAAGREADPSTGREADPSTLATGDTFLSDNGLPISTNFAAYVQGRTRLLTPSDGYIVNINAIGETPTYNYSILYRPEWGSRASTKTEMSLASPDGRLEHGVKFAGSGTVGLQAATCLEVLRIMLAGRAVAEGAERAMVHGVGWDRVRYSGSTGRSRFRGVMQCLTTADARIVHYLTAGEEQWQARGAELEKILNDIYIARVAKPTR